MNKMLSATLSLSLMWYGVIAEKLHTRSIKVNFGQVFRSKQPCQECDKARINLGLIKAEVDCCCPDCPGKCSYKYRGNYDFALVDDCNECCQEAPAKEHDVDDDE